MNNPSQGLAGSDVSRETLETLNAYAKMLQEENRRQNLISARSEPELWSRHILDCAQLARFGVRKGSWLDIGSGAGLPGIVLAIVTGGPMVLAEPRRLRAEFLERVKSHLGLTNVTVERQSASSMSGRFNYITARAVASTDKIFGMSRHLTHDGTLFILPKGRSAQSELDEAKRSWQGNFRLEPSLTSDDGAILIASSVRPRGKR